MVAALSGLWAGLLAGALLSLLSIAAFKLWPLPIHIPLWGAAFPLVGALIGAIACAWKRPSTTEIARWVDHKQALQERLSTALEVLPAANDWAALVLTDAAAHASRVDPRKLAPFRLTTAAKIAAIILLAAAMLGFVPEQRSELQKRRQADAENIRETGRRISELSRRLVEKRPPTVQSTQVAMETAMDLGKGLERATLTRMDAMREISSAAEKIRARAKTLADDPALKQMRQAARSAGGEVSSREALQKQIETLKNQLGTESSFEQIDKLRSKLARMEQTARASTDGGLGAGANQEIAAGLSELARQAQALGLNLPELDAAIEALAAQQTDRFLQKLEAAMSELEKLSEMSKTLQALQQQAARIGRDLAEQLKNGQAESARETLSKLARQLQDSRLSPDQLGKVLEEVQKAIPASENYGRVSDHLKKAASEMQCGKSGEAAASLQAAAKELESLMQQFGDAETLMATLDALNQASMCIGAGQCWQPGRRPGAGNGSRPGAGVGTWADATQQWDAPPGEMVDNSGFQRPDMDPRSADAERQEGAPLSPTKIRGQFSQGGQMPSISLKGVGIKGQSTVGYEQAAEAAQSEADSALSQEKVPRSYRESVKNYFDEIRN